MRPFVKAGPELGHRRTGPLLALALVANLVLPSPAAGAVRAEDRLPATPELIEAARRGGEIGRAQADLFLARALGPRWRLVPERFLGDVPWDGTLPLLHLRERVANMAPGPARSAIVEELSAEAAGSCSGASAGPSTHVSTYFSIDHGTIGGGLNISAYATSLDGARTKEINTFGWAAPPLLPSAPGGKYHVVVADLAPGLYGFVSPSGTYAGFIGDNPNTGWNDVDAYASCMALNDNYSGFPSPPQASLDSTTAHEFNHSIQFGYGGLTGANAPDAAFVEGGATWMEDEVFDGANDNYNYLWPDFTDDMGSYSASPYPYWIVFRALTERYGTGVAGGGEDVMQRFWEETSKNSGNNLTAMQTGLAGEGTTLATAYHQAAIALKFQKGCVGGYVYPYCLQEAVEYVANAGANAAHKTIASVGGNVIGSVPDNYSLNWVALPTAGGPYDVTLQNRSHAGGQLRGSVVCDTGSALAVTPLPAVVLQDSFTTYPSYNPSGCTQVVLVITNQAQTTPNPSSSTNRGYGVQTAVSGPDTTAPETTIDSGPTGETTSTSATFEFSSNELGTFQCNLDGGAFVACDSPQTYTDLTLGPHTFQVRATDLASNVDPTPATRDWTVIPPPVTHGRTVSLGLRKHLIASGLVTAVDGFGACAAGEPVRIERKKAGWKLVKRAVTDGAGKYRVRLRDREGRYRAVLAAGSESAADLCGRAASPPRRHRH
jgi:hypothetical protein